MDEKITEKLEKEKKILDDEMKKMKARKLEIEKRIKNKKNVKKEKSKNDSPANKLIRVSTKFDKNIDIINDKREENGFDRLFKPKITDLIVRHDHWRTIKEDIINFDVDKEEKEIIGEGNG